MENNFYKKYLFIPDLTLISVWSLFAARYTVDASISVIVIIILRIALCFQLRNHGKWVLYSACTFLFAYIYMPGNSCFEYATQSMGYHIWYLFDSKSALSTYTEPHYSYPSNWILALQVFWIGWNIIMPVIVGIVQLLKRSKKQILRTFCLCSIVSLTEIVFYCSFYHYSTAISLFTIGFAIFPYVRWLIINRQSRRMKILSDRDFITYTSIVAIFLAAVLIGLREVYLLRPIALMTFPVFIYYAVVTSVRSTPRLYACVLAISGFAFWLSLQSLLETKIVCMTISFGGILYVGVKMKNSIHRIFVPILFVFAIPFLLYPTICGYNPYTVLYAENTRPFLKNIYTRNGLFVTQKDGKYGLRDRYGEILSPRYQKFEVLDPKGRVISVEICDSTFNGAGLSYPHYGIYDLRKQQFIINPDSVDVDFIYHKDDETYQLHKTYRDDYEILAELIMPGYYYSDYFADPHLEPYFEDEDNPVSYFLGLGYQMGDDYDGRDITDLKFPNKHAHNIFARFLAIIHEKESPMNDLNRAKAFQRFVDDSPYYKGNTALAIKHIEDAIAPLNAEVNGEPILYQAYLRDLASIRMSLAYSDLLAESYWVTDVEYRTYHNLCTALFNGYFTNRSWHGHYEEPYQTVLAKSRRWYEDRAHNVVLETRLWNGDTINIEKGDGIKNIDEVNHMLLPLAPTKDNPYRFYKTWLELHTALNEWYKARCLVAEELKGKQKQQYIMLTNQILTRHYDDIRDIVSGQSL